MKKGAEGTMEMLASMPLMERQRATNLNDALTSFRQTSEWGNRGLKGPFARFYMPQHKVHFLTSTNADSGRRCGGREDLSSRSVAVFTIFACASWG
jgi:hypothetical protein